MATEASCTPRPRPSHPAPGCRQPRFVGGRSDRARRNRLIEEALPLADGVARKYRASAVPFEDLLQVARLGLVKAAERFDPSRGSAFSAYAIPTMMGEIKRYLRDTTWALHVPRVMQERVLRLEEGAMAPCGARSPSLDEVAAAAGLTQQEASQAMEASRAYRAEPLEALGGSGEGDHWLARLGGDDPGFELVEERDALRRGARRLRPQERRVIGMRFFEDMTQVQIAERLGVSQMQVSRLVCQALRRLLEESKDAGSDRAWEPRLAA